jgi:plasmid stabilization system protein ParE
MISLNEMNLCEKLAIRLFPARRRKYEQDLRKAIEYLVDHPEAPCAIEGTLIPNGFERTNYSLRNAKNVQFAQSVS